MLRSKGEAWEGICPSQKAEGRWGLLLQQGLYNVHVLFVLNGISLNKTSPQAPTLLSSQPVPLTLLAARKGICLSQKHTITILREGTVFLFQGFLAAP